jgi:hypothetical protein
MAQLTKQATQLLQPTIDRGNDEAIASYTEWSKNREGPPIELNAEQLNIMTRRAQEAYGVVTYDVSEQGLLPSFKAAVGAQSLAPLQPSPEAAVGAQSPGSRVRIL